MMLKSLLSILVLLGMSFSSICHAQEMANVQLSYIKGNVPSAENFDSFLKRDLKAYFKNDEQKNTLVEYEMLRDGPTQSGVAYPKYYVWVKISSKGIIQNEGAARVAAIDKTKFEITDFLSKAEIRSFPDSVSKIFPAALISKINSLALR